MKRAFDVVVAAAALVLLALPLLAIALAVRLCLGKPVFFMQLRTSMHGATFKIVKFRTMREAVDAQGRPLPDEERLTRLGTFLRATSLDELPELWNVLRGDMSLVGPRPLLPEYLPLYSAEQARRHEVKAGLTGWAQVNGRNGPSWEERFRLDVWYVDHASLWLDLKILALTVWKIIQRDGISQQGHATMPDFLGSPPQRTATKQSST